MSEKLINSNEPFHRKSCLLEHAPYVLSIAGSGIAGSFMTLCGWLAHERWESDVLSDKSLPWIFHPGRAFIIGGEISLGVFAIVSIMYLYLYGAFLWSKVVKFFAKKEQASLGLKVFGSVFVGLHAVIGVLFVTLGSLRLQQFMDDPAHQMLDLKLIKTPGALLIFLGAHSIGIGFLFIVLFLVKYRLFYLCHSQMSLV